MYGDHVVYSTPSQTFDLLIPKKPTIDETYNEALPASIYHILLHIYERALAYQASFHLANEATKREIDRMKWVVYAVNSFSNLTSLDSPVDWADDVVDEAPPPQPPRSYNREVKPIPHNPFTVKGRRASFGRQNAVETGDMESLLVKGWMLPSVMIRGW